MRNPLEEYDRLHDHCQALGRERDRLQIQIKELQAQNEHFFNQGNLWASLMHELGEHLGNALYSDEWRTREYAIVAFNHYQRANPDHERDVDEMLDR
jgi:hypothetical protein